MEGERRSSDHLNGDALTKSTPAWKDEGSIDMTEDIEAQYTALLQDTQTVEKKIAVDRRKLERLIIAGKGNETADEFFQRIMSITGTLILWPSRLKIGAKSKKDPHVKIAGPAEGVSKARELLLNDLDTRSNRVTLKVNIANGEHSHVIGREGTNIKKVHSETQCHIHFPDSNKFSHQGEKSDQVSITGPYPAVEIARKRVRELQPVVVSLTLPLHRHVEIDHNSSDMMDISQTYNVTITIKPQPQMMSMVVTVRGSMKFIEGLKLAVSKIVEYFTGDVQFTPPVLLYTDIAQQHHRTIIGREGGNLQGIMHETCTTIQMPDYYHTSQVTINGPLDNAIEARNRLMGCLPVALLFDVADEEGNITDAFIGDLMSKLDVFLNVKPKAKQTTQCVIIKSIEQNLECVYEARRILCDYACQPHATAVMPAQQIHKQTISEETEKTDNIEHEADGKYNEQSPSISPSPAPIIATTTGPSVMKVEVTDTVTVIPPPTYSSQKPVSPNSEGNSKLTTQPSLSGSQSRLTVRAMIDYEKKKKQAEMAIQSAVDPNIKRYPTDTFSGILLSSSMPHQSKEQQNFTASPVAKGLESLHRSGNKALLTQASFERKQAISQEQNVYENITDLTTLLSHFGLEKYEEKFIEEEIDFETFLTMSEDDLKEVGVSTLGARRKLQIAISEIKKLKQKPDKVALPLRPALTRQTNNSSRSMMGSTRLAPGYMSRSVRF